MNSESPGRKVWKRYKGNKLSMFGTLVIGFSALIALFCYLIMPDNTPDANRMCLPLCNQSPGFAVKMLKVKRNRPAEQQPFFSVIMEGRKSNDELIPVKDFRFSGDEIIYHEYSSNESDSAIEQRINVADVLFALNTDVKVKSENNTLTFIAVGGEQRHANTAQLITQIEKENIINKRFLLGTDRYGRDLLSRLLAGTRVTLAVGFIAVIISLLIGVTLGALAGFFRGWVDEVVLWLINVVWSIPTLLLVIAITLVLGKGFSQVFIAVGCTMWVEVARIVRGQIFSIREIEYVNAARALGFRNQRIIARHILPNILGPVMVIAAANFSTSVLLEAGLSFLGIGAQPPMPSWGGMIKENYAYIIIPGSAYLAILPGLAILLLAMSFTFVGNGLRDAMDSKIKVNIA